MRSAFALILLISCLLPLTAAELKVATLHPLLADLTRQVGGDRVEVVELVTATDDPHHFEPTPRQIAATGDVDLCLASGMGLETYLPDLASLLPEDTRLIEIGDDLPALEGACDHPDHDHDHGGHEHAVDPHWWHSIDAFRRAASLLGGHLADVDPAGTDQYRAAARRVRGELDELEIWTRRQLATIPRERRVLATAHSAFAYFCRDFGFTAIPVQGLNREQMPDAGTLARLIERLESENVPAIFPEKRSNPKILDALTADTGIRLAEPLYADGTGVDSYDAMIRHNVRTIVEALK